MLDLLATVADTAHRTPETLLALPDPSTSGGQAPPGAEKLTLIARWIFWSVSLLCVVGLLLVAGKLAVSWHNGESTQTGRGLFAVMAACVLAGSASGIVAALL